MIPSLDVLTPTTRDAARAWLDASVGAVDADLRDGVRDELTIALCEGLEEHSSPDDLAGLVAAIGPIAAEGEPGAAAADDPRVGTRWGIPFDWRPPTGERLRAALWNPASPDLLQPRVFGAGWDVNLGALAVRLGLIEPDAEDEPFACTPDDAFVLAAGLPALLGAGVVAHYAVRGSTLPPRLPSHWDAVGAPDRWVTRRTAALTDLAAAATGAAVGTLAAGSDAPRAGRAGRLALAAGIAGFAATSTVARSVPRGGWWVGPLMMASIVGSAGATLLGLAWAGRDAERRRDLGAR